VCLKSGDSPATTVPFSIVIDVGMDVAQADSHSRANTEANGVAAGHPSLSRLGSSSRK
jgi:hypothetical protein